MKKVLHLLLACVVALTACKKDNEPTSEPQVQKTKVVFSVSDFSQEVTTLSKAGSSVSEAGDTLRNHAKYLYCEIFDELNSLIPSIVIRQTADSADFGKIEVALPPSTYKVFFLASNELIDVYSFRNQYRNLKVIRPANQTYWDDTFISYRYTVVVGTEDKAETVRLDRLVGAVEVNIEDVIPQNAAKIVLQTASDAAGYLVEHHSFVDPVESTKEFILHESDKDQKNRKFLIHFLRDSYTGSPEYMTLKIMAYNTQNVLIAEKVINNVQCYGRRKTLLTGSLFSSSSTTNVTVKPEWDSPSAPITF